MNILELHSELFMNRRNAIMSSVGLFIGTNVAMAVEQDRFDTAAEILRLATSSGEVAAATLHVQQGEIVFSRCFGVADSVDAIFLLASISKPIVVAAVMTLYEKSLFELDHPVQKFLPEFTGGGRERITMRQLFCHNSGLPDQLPENAKLRAKHAELAEFVEGAIKTPLMFKPGTRYGYSSMGILIASEVARRISGKSIATLVDEEVYQPLGMAHSALGVGRFPPKSLMRCQVDKAAAESGAGDPNAKDWDWNSDYWRKLGSPWGGAHGSATDVAQFLNAFLHPQGKLLRPETTRLMIHNQNSPGIRPRGLGFDVGSTLNRSPGSDAVFGHSGSTGTLCWADPRSETICVVLTTLPADAVDPHPRATVSDAVVKAI